MNDLQHIILQITLMLIFIVGAMACLGNPNGVSISFPPEAYDSEQAHYFCQQAPACNEKNNSILYITEENLAASVGQIEGKGLPVVNIEIPVDDKGNATFEYNTWNQAYEKELGLLSKAKVLALTEEDIQGIIKEKLIAGYILVYSNKDGVAETFRAKTTIEQDSGTGGASAGAIPTTEYCSGPVITIGDLPKKNNLPVSPPQEEKEDIITIPDISLPFLTPMSAPAATQESIGNNTPIKEKPKNFVVTQYWWLILIVFAITLLVFKLQLGGKEEEITTEDFSVLSAPRRIEMMRSLTERNKTLTELSKEEDISLPTAKEHLEKLEKSGLVRKLDTGHKWKYYELTRKGDRILKSTDTKNN
ncbi:winged helix-turn-helix domain-containing protein [archaeon]|nr:winged helix-turn-helix domain-containing protein [archaeon]